MKKASKPKNLSRVKPPILLARAYLGRFLVLGAGLVFVSLLPGQNRYQIQHLEKLKYPFRALKTTYLKPNPYPSEIGFKPPPDLTAKAAIVLDLDSKTVLYEKNSHVSLPPASTTKLMTAWVSRQAYDLNEPVTVSKLNIDGSVMNLVPGEKITVNSLLYGLLINSANDAALTLAKHYPGGNEQFLSSMNDWAKKMNLNDTHFTNVIGLDNPNHYTSVWDLAQLSSFVLQDKVLSEIVSQKKALVTDVNRRLTHQLKTTNKLLDSNSNIKGLKTGWTEDAGGCLTAYLITDHHRLLSVILGSQTEATRFSEAQALFDWVLTNYHWEPVDFPASIQALSSAGT